MELTSLVSESLDLYIVTSYIHFLIIGCNQGAMQILDCSQKVKNNNL